MNLKDLMKGRAKTVTPISAAKLDSAAMNAHAVRAVITGWLAGHTLISCLVSHKLKRFLCIYPTSEMLAILCEWYFPLAICRVIVFLFQMTSSGCSVCLHSTQATTVIPIVLIHLTQKRDFSPRLWM